MSHDEQFFTGPDDEIGLPEPASEEEWEAANMAFIIGLTRRATPDEQAEIDNEIPF